VPTAEAAAAALLFDDSAAVFADAERMPSPLGEACLPPVGPSAFDEGMLPPPDPQLMSIDVSARQPAGEPAAAGEPLLLRELLGEVASSAVDPCARQLGPEAIESCFDVLSTEAAAETEIQPRCSEIQPRYGRPLGGGRAAHSQPHACTLPTPCLHTPNPMPAHSQPHAWDGRPPRTQREGREA